MADVTTIAVFCGSKLGGDPRHAGDARAFGRALAGRGIRLVYGGGRIGLMGVLADAALAAGGAVTGVIPRFLRAYEVEHKAVTELIEVESMHARKARMFAEADAFVVLAGGLGTLDEMIEVVTWKQLRLHAKPVVIYDPSGYWAPLAALVGAAIEGGFAHAKVRELYATAATIEGVFDAIAAAPEPAAEVLESHL
jgi:hypothetical protein